MTARRWYLVSLIVALLLIVLTPHIAGAQDIDVGPDSGPPLGQLSDAAIWAIILGMFSPWITAVINRVTWDPLVKTAVFVLVAVALAGISTWINGGIDQTNWTRSALIVIATGAAFYKLWTRPVTVVEART